MVRIYDTHRKENESGDVTIFSSLGSGKTATRSRVAVLAQAPLLILSSTLPPSPVATASFSLAGVPGEDIIIPYKRCGVSIGFSCRIGTSR